MKILIKIITFLIFVTPISTHNLYADEKIKIGLLIPLSGKQSEIGKSIMLSVRLAINKINNSNIEILPKDTKNDPIKTLIAAKELGLRAVIVMPVTTPQIKVKAVNTVLTQKRLAKRFKNVPTGSTFLSL